MRFATITPSISFNRFTSEMRFQINFSSPKKSHDLDIVDLIHSIRSSFSSFSFFPCSLIYGYKIHDIIVSRKKFNVDSTPRYPCHSRHSSPSSQSHPTFSRPSGSSIFHTVARVTTHSPLPLCVTRNIYSIRLYLQRKKERKKERRKTRERR